MHLEQLEIAGFKSFGQKVVFEFGKGVTAVVGPNGSGKSNVSDALRWVMGEQSMKSVRGRSSEDVLFSGSSTKRRAQVAEVVARFDNSDGVFPIEAKQVEVARRLERGGDQKYFINRTQVRLYDVLELLAKAGFAQRTYGVVSQGSIAELIDADESRRLEMFEDAAGVTKFKLKRDRALRKLRSAQKNMDEMKLQLAELEPEYVLLQRKARQAERREKLEKEFERVGYVYFSSRVQRSQHDQRVAKVKFDDIGERLDKITNELALHGNTQRAFEKKYAALSRARQALDMKRDELRDGLAKLQTRRAEILGEIKVEQAKQAQDELRSLQRRVQSQEERLAEMRIKRAAVAEKLMFADQAVIDQRATLEKIRAERRKLVDELRAFEEEVATGVSEDEMVARLSQVYARHRAFVEVMHSCKSVEVIPSLYQNAVHIKNELQDLIKRSSGETDERVLDRLVEVREQVSEFDGRIGQMEKDAQRLERDKMGLESGLDAQEQQISYVENELDVLRRDWIARSHKHQAIPDRVAICEENLRQIDAKIEVRNDQLGMVSDKLEELAASFVEREEKLSELTAKVADARTLHDKLQREQHGVDLELTRLESKFDDLREDVVRDHDEQMWSRVVLGDVIAIDLGVASERYEEVRRALGRVGEVDHESVMKFAEVKERYEFLREQYEDVVASAEKLRGVVAELQEDISLTFLRSFNKISKAFSAYFEQLFEGGEAKMRLVRAGVDDERDARDFATPGIVDVASDEKRLIVGIELTATPPGKSLETVRALSGGEKAMTALALLCAILSVNPSPVVMLDEVEAALDEANTVRFTSILKELSDTTQFIVITHNRQTMTAASALYGVTMQRDGISRLLSVKLERAQQMVDTSETPRTRVRKTVDGGVEISRGASLADIRKRLTASAS